MLLDTFEDLNRGMEKGVNKKVSTLKFASF